ncbi:DUF6370 family protein [Flavobacterium sp.]|uniref:DUF6370 family protein n=1 Tax=Flavobacterium sp. TaxID=239 RepID=UPI00286BA50A|nr:DUF6370 family protein [Flavobacterium sp.]
MKKITTILIIFFCFAMHAQTKAKTQIIEVACGQCQFGMKAKGCDLATRIDGKSYFINGTKIDDHGDAHAKDGFCSAVRKAEVIGQIKDNRFVVSYFKLLPIK